MALYSVTVSSFLSPPIYICYTLQSVYFATCGSSIQAVQCCVSNAKLSTSAFISAGSSFSGSGNYVETSTTEVTTCRDNPNLLVFKESSGESSCFSNTGTGVCEGDCATGFSDAGSCGISGADLEMSPVASPGAAAGGSSCPASPPTPVPTLAPGVSPGSIASVDNGQTGITEKPVFSNTLPPGQPGGSPTDGNGPSSGSSNNDGSSGSSGSSNNGGGGGSAAATPNSFGPMFAAALVVLGMLI